MYSQEEFLNSVLSFLSKSASGALMISGAWGSGKTYFVKKTLNKRIEDNQMFPITISLFGQSNLDGLEKRITEVFLQEYEETKLLPVEEKDIPVFTRIQKLLDGKKVQKRVSEAKNISDLFPFLGQFINMGGVVDAYVSLCSKRLPKDKIVLILDDLERTVKTIPTHQLLGMINDLIETKSFKVILIANDSYFNKAADTYLDFKEKVIERTLFFPSDIISIYKAFISDYGEEFEQWMMDPNYIRIIDPEADIYNSCKEIQEDLSNLRILKFAIGHFASVFQALSETIKANPDNQNLKSFILSLWALTVFLSIEFKRNHLTYLDKEDFTKPHKFDLVSVLAFSPYDNPIKDDPTDKYVPISRDDKDQDQDKNKEKDKISIHEILQNYYRPHKIPYIPCVFIFDLVTAGIHFPEKSLQHFWEQYRVQAEKQRQNPAETLLSEIHASLTSFTDEEFPLKVQELANYMEQATFSKIESYIYAANDLLHFGILINKDYDAIRDLIIKGIDKYFDDTATFPEYVKSDLNMISPTELPIESQWVLDYLNEKMNAHVEKENYEVLQGAIRQFKEDLPALADRLAPNTSKVPDFYSIPVLAQIPEDIIIDKIKNITPDDVKQLNRIIYSRFIQKQCNVSDREKSFLIGIKHGIEARERKPMTFTDILIDDLLMSRLAQLS